MPDGVVNFGDVSCRARIQRIELIAARRVAGEPLFVLLQGLEGIEAGEVDRARRPAQGLQPQDVHRILELLRHARVFRGNFVVGSIHVGFYIDRFDVKDVGWRDWRSLLCGQSACQRQGQSGKGTKPFLHGCPPQGRKEICGRGRNRTLEGLLHVPTLGPGSACRPAKGRHG